MLDPMSDGAWLVARKLDELLQAMIDEDGGYGHSDLSIDRSALLFNLDGYINLNQLAVRLVELFYGGHERSAEMAHLLAIRLDRPEAKQVEASPDHE